MRDYSEPNSRPEDLARILVEDIVSRLGADRLMPKAQKRWQDRLTRLLQIDPLYELIKNYLDRTSWDRVKRVVKKWEKECGTEDKK